MDSTVADNSQPKPDFANRLLDWYERHARTMPWRISPHDHAQGVRQDPYRIWLSEVMLQQTQVATVKDYFLKFVTLWPQVENLAAADLEDVLKAWAGLGYYSRARNLKKCADTIMAEHGGMFPDTFEALRQLPGIGDYTAAAIASIAFDRPVTVMDGNIERVMSRHYRIETPLPKSKPKIKSLLAHVLDHEKPGEFAQAMMDLGATICTPKRPACALCPINADCMGFKSGDAERFPIKLPKPEKPTRKGAAFIIENREGQIFLCKRGDTGLLAGMTEVPTTDWAARQDGIRDASGAPFEAQWNQIGTAKHTFTHFHLELNVWKTLADHVPDVKGWWCDVTELENEALPTVMRKVISVALPDVFKKAGK